MHDLPLVEMDWLAVLPALERFVVLDDSEDSEGWMLTRLYPPATTTFSHLIELTIGGAWPVNNFFRSFPSPCATPKLRVLAVKPPYRHLEGDPPVLLPSLLRQLDILSLPHRTEKDEPRYSSPPALDDCLIGYASLSDILRRPSIRLRYVPHPEEYGPDQPEVEMVKDLFALSSAILTASRRLRRDTKLRCFSISSYFTSSKRSNHNLKPAVQALVAIAEANDIEVAVESDEGFSPRVR